MNGHSTAEALAFGMLDIERKYGCTVGNKDVAPIFLFAAGHFSGERELQQCLPYASADTLAFSASLIEALSRQLIHLASATSSTGNGDSMLTAIDSRTLTVPATIASHARLFRELCEHPREGSQRDNWTSIVTGMSADHAVYLQVLFPQAKFIFLHRNPLDTFAHRQRALHLQSPTEVRDPRWSESFAENWCRLVASFHVWHKHVGGIVVRYDRITEGAVSEIEEYLGARLSPPSSWADQRHEEHPPLLDAADRAVIIERCSTAAVRCGYTLGAVASAQPSGETSTELTAAWQAVHTHDKGLSCAVLVPTMRYIEPECEDALAELERRGYAVIPLRGCSSIDRARNMLVTKALEHGFEETIWIDADTAFDPDSVELLRSHKLPIVGGVYPRRQPSGGLAMAPLPGTRELVMGEGGGLVEVLYAGTGFLFVSCDVYVAIQQRFSLPLCDKAGPDRAIPFFMPMLEDWDGQLSYLAEDYAFSRRARLCGYKIMADTRIRLWHIGMYRYRFEDAGNEVGRVATYKHVFGSDQCEDRS